MVLRIEGAIGKLALAAATRHNALNLHRHSSKTPAFFC